MARKPRAAGSRKARAPKKKVYLPTYQVPSLVAQVAFRLTEPRRHVTVGELEAEFQLQRRRVQRYLKGLRSGVFNGEFHPSVLRLEDKTGEEIAVDEEDLAKIPETRIDRVRLVAAAGARAAEGATEELIPVYLAFTVLRYLEGIVPREEISGLWRDLARRLAPDQSLLVANIEGKFYSVPYTPKDYSGCQAVLSVVIDALIRQHVLRIEYYGLSGEGRTHRFEAYTLAMYKGGLYLVGRSDHAEKPIYLTIERIDRAEKVLDDNGEPLRFRVPADYSPQGHFQGLFGIMEGEDTEIELEIQNAETAARLRERTIHPSQSFLEPGRSGRDKAVLRMRVRGTKELLWWIVSLGPYVKVLRPK
ncbi:MAG: helix-turn-helix transcriptional regulator, partial [Candidatus Binatia bacterium]